MSYLGIKYNKGFTLIELLVVISIIGLLSSVVLASLNIAKARARDADRITDVDQIVNALFLYYDSENHWLQAGSGCGWQGGGNGWFNYTGTNYPKSMAQCLVDKGLTGGLIVDPSGNKTSSPSSGNTYMKYSCVQSGKTVTYVFAKLETIPQSSSATNGTCCAACDSYYGMNYFKKID